MIVSGTGHRPDKLTKFGKPYTTEQHFGIVEVVIDWLEGHEVKKVISGMALGYDMALAHAAVELDIPFIAAVPFEGQERMWSPKSKAFFKTLLDKAAEVVYVCDPGYAPWKMQKRNEWMVDNSNVLLALYNGDKTGGTANCVRYAESKGKVIVNLWEDE